jgi:hypothetical protein
MYSFVARSRAARTIIFENHSSHDINGLFIVARGLSWRYVEMLVR